MSTDVTIHSKHEFTFQPFFNGYIDSAAEDGDRKQGEREGE